MSSITAEERSRWRKSSYSHKNGACVEVRNGREVALRDSKRTNGPVLAIGREAFTALVRRIK